MVIDAEAALRAVSIVLDTTEGHNTAMGSLQGSFLTGLCTFFGSLIAGPRGIVPGAAVGAFLAYFMKKDSYKSLAEVVQQDLSPSERQELVRSTQRVISSFNVVDVALLLSLARSNENFQKEILTCVHNFVESTVSRGNALGN